MAHYGSSIGNGLNDLDGWSGDADFYSTQQHQVDDSDFGFDPPNRDHMYAMKMQQTFTPPNHNDTMSRDFMFDPHLLSKVEPNYIKNEPSPPSDYEIREIMLDNIAAVQQNQPHTISRYGQVTPPRSNSEASVDKVEQKPTRAKRQSKAALKDDSQPAPGRKRRNTRRSSSQLAITGNPEEDSKRKQSLEKNRLAAAKCRVNKKEKTEQLQRDSHEMAVKNAYLKENVMRLKEEVQQMNALLLSHAKCEGCKSPDNIQEHLNHLGNEYMNNRMYSMGSVPHETFGFTPDPLDGSSEFDTMDHLSPSTVMTDSGMHPPLPDFDQSEFDDMIGSPMRME